MFPYYRTISAFISLLDPAAPSISKFGRGGRDGGGGGPENGKTKFCAVLSSLTQFSNQKKVPLEEKLKLEKEKKNISNDWSKN